VVELPATAINTNNKQKAGKKFHQLNLCYNCGKNLKKLTRMGQFFKQDLIAVRYRRDKLAVSEFYK
jgi:hypothetical protein